LDVVGGGDGSILMVIRCFKILTKSESQCPQTHAPVCAVPATDLLGIRKFWTT
jgi:hypothetical protein